MLVFINNNARFCYQSNEKVLSSNIFRGIQIWTKNTKMENLVGDGLEKSESDESDSDSNDETESDDESNK